RSVLEEIRAVVRAASELPLREPPRDLWPGVAAAIRDAGSGAVPAHPAADVIVLPTGGAAPLPRRVGRGRGRERARLAVAAVALVALSASATWWVATSRPGAATVGPEPAPPAGGVSAAGAAVPPPPALADQLRALEGVLESAREVLDPATILVLERNLGIIERAIADSRRALELEPDNPFLSEHLERMYRRKVLYLQDVERAVEWAG
ncbi:MAG TPA: hypothetical protein VFQ22_09285, partial [Longimicrobiales bacterium]|nr:hypothetical protein [Longimicrobiales bacterium]